MSEKTLNGTSAQCYIVPFMSVHAGKYGTEDKLKTNTTKTIKLNKTQKKRSAINR